MPEPTITIRDLRLRVPGLSPREARQFAEQVVQQLAGQLPETGRSRQLGAVNLRLPQVDGARPPHPHAVAAEILRRIG